MKKVVHIFLAVVIGCLSVEWGGGTWTYAETLKLSRRTNVSERRRCIVPRAVNYYKILQAQRCAADACFSTPGEVFGAGADTALYIFSEKKQIACIGNTTVAFLDKEFTFPKPLHNFSDWIKPSGAAVRFRIQVGKRRPVIRTLTVGSPGGGERRVSEVPFYSVTHLRVPGGRLRYQENLDLPAYDPVHLFFTPTVKNN